MKKENDMRILFVCAGNTCRSPMAKVIMEQKLKAARISDKFEIDSGAYGRPTMNYVSAAARAAIKIKYGEDLLASHKPRKITPALVRQADIILVMAGWMKEGLPQSKTFTLKDFAGGSGDILDPFGQGIDTYLAVADEIAEIIDKILPKLKDS